MRQLAVVVALVALLMAAARFTPDQRILPDSFSADFPEHREHHEQLLRNLGQKPLRDYPGDVVRFWYVSEGPKKLLIVEPTTVTRIHYTTAGYTPRVTEWCQAAAPMKEGSWEGMRELWTAPELERMTADPGLGPFTLGGKTWILEMKLGGRYRVIEKIDPKPALFTEICERMLGL